MDNKQKGDAFERWVITNFDINKYSVEEWRSDKYHEGIFPKSSLLPDFEISVKDSTTQNKDVFAIECKWRSNFYNGGINWAKDYQIKNYKDYSESLNIPVFIVLGIGGMPDDPMYLYIIPLNKIEQGFISRKELDLFQCDYLGRRFRFLASKKELVFEFPENYNWAMYVDIEGFSNIFRKNKHNAIKAMALLTEAIFIVNKSHPSLKIIQFGSDGFLIMQKNIRFPGMDFPVLIGSFIMQFLLYHGYTSRLILSFGTMENVSTFYPNHLREMESGNQSEIYLNPYTGTAIINTYTLKAAKGPLFVVDDSLDVVSLNVSNGLSKYFSECDKNYKVCYFNWIDFGCELMFKRYAEEFIELPTILKGKLKAYLRDNHSDFLNNHEWVNNAEKLLG